MDERRWLAERFDEHRPHLEAVALRMLGSSSEAERAVREARLLLERGSSAGVGGLGGWLTTVVARVCLDALRTRRTPGAEAVDDGQPEPLDGAVVSGHDALLGESAELALLGALETLSPAERAAFVLHDVFDLPFEDVATVLGRSAGATRQLANRARRHVHGGRGLGGAEPGRARRLVETFLAAARGGDLEALLALLDADVVLRSDGAAVLAGAPAEVRGAGAVAETFTGHPRTRGAELAAGAVGAVWAPEGHPRVVFAFAVEDGQVVGIGILADPERLADLEVTILDT